MHILGFASACSWVQLKHICVRDQGADHDCHICCQLSATTEGKPLLTEAWQAVPADETGQDLNVIGFGCDHSFWKADCGRVFTLSGSVQLERGQRKEFQVEIKVALLFCKVAKLLQKTALFREQKML